VIRGGFNQGSVPGVQLIGFPYGRRRVVTIQARTSGVKEDYRFRPPEGTPA
jgi:hypothetical protein